MASLKLLVGGASAIGASALTSYLLMTDNTVSIIDFIRSLFHSLFAGYDFFFVKANRARDMEFSV